MAMLMTQKSGERDWVSGDDVRDELRRLFDARKGGDPVGSAGAAGAPRGGRDDREGGDEMSDCRVPMPVYRLDLSMEFTGESEVGWRYPMDVTGRTPTELRVEGIARPELFGVYVNGMRLSWPPGKDRECEWMNEL